uniref:FYVE-type domain-containing protein n=1 Tax=Haemonchus contortus TaxID=6289 RepID=A0A7I4Y7X1_HAECO|nr:Zinc finger domain containing protein [Haemonchus contortus]
METVPDMDALLDELEEVVVGNRRKESKIQESTVEQAVVIELPVHLRKLSEKETIRIELKPPDPVLPSLEDYSNPNSVSSVAEGEISASDESNQKSSTLSTQVGDNRIHEESITDDEKHTGESDRDTEFEEVLQYLNQFEDKNPDVVGNDNPAAIATLPLSQEGIDECTTSTKLDLSDMTDSTPLSEIPINSSQSNDLAALQMETVENVQGSDDESSQSTDICAIAKAVVDDILDRVDAHIEGDFSTESELVEDDHQEGRNNDIIVHSDEVVSPSQSGCFSEKQTCEDSGFVDVEKGEDASECASSAEGVESSTTDSASFVTVIHRPTTTSCSEHESQERDVENTQNDEDDQTLQTGNSTEISMRCAQSDLTTVATEARTQSETESREEAPNRPESLELSSQDQAKDDGSSVELPRGDPTELGVNESNLSNGDPSLIDSNPKDDHEDHAVAEESTQETESLSSPRPQEPDSELESPEECRSKRAGSEESTHGLETAIECETKEDVSPPAAGPRDRFGAQVISTIHDLSQDTDPMRLTESELQLGKSKPYWIPDDDCSMCMLCNSRFSLLNRRHHCRACGRVACGSCCKEKATLEYMKDDPKKQAQARVCTPCAIMLARIEDYEKMMREHAEENVSDETPPSTSTFTSSRVSRGVLKTRTTNVSEAEAETSQPSDSSEKKRSVVFRDGVKPGASSPCGQMPATEEKSSAVKPKKKNRKRHAVARRVAELRLEDELGCALPTSTRTQLLVVCPNGEMDMVEEEWVSSRLKEELPVTIVLKKNLSCVAKICKVGSLSVFCVHSCGFATIGLDEVLFVWKREDLNDFTLPLNVLHRIAQIFSTSCDADQAGVRQVHNRLPPIHSVPIAVPPLSRHILFFRPTLQDFTSLSLPNSPFLIALFLNDAEVPWAMACPNRLLFRLGLKYSWYPTPIVNFPGRPAMFSVETSQTVLKVFTDFRSWSFRMKHLAGSTVTLSNDVTLVEIPKSGKDDLEEIISFNRKMLAWSTNTNLTADSHLVCDETDGVYSTQVLARGSTRKATGASFVIIDGGLKTNGLQISVVEDGVAIRIPSEKLESLLQALNSADNWVTSDASGTQFVVRWTDGSGQPTPFGPVSPIDGQNLANKFQYGLSLERAISSVLQVNSVPDYGVRLSHVYNLKDGRLAPEDEPKVFSIAEMLARECTGMLEPYLSMLINMNITSISVRVGVSADTVEYDVSPWFGMEEEQLMYKQNMDQLIPVLYDILGYLTGGFHIELVLSFVSTKSLPYMI